MEEAEEGGWKNIFHEYMQKTIKRDHMLRLRDEIYGFRLPRPPLANQKWWMREGRKKRSAVEKFHPILLCLSRRENLHLQLEAFHHFSSILLLSPPPPPLKIKIFPSDHLLSSRFFHLDIFFSFLSALSPMSRLWMGHPSEKGRSGRKLYELLR